MDFCSSNLQVFFTTLSIYTFHKIYRLNSIYPIQSDIFNRDKVESSITGLKAFVCRCYQDRIKVGLHSWGKKADDNLRHLVAHIFPPGSQEHLIAKIAESFILASQKFGNN